jgi:predicted ABC-type ATPase
MASEGSQQPIVVVIGGPNGAGKTTCASLLLPEAIGLRQFVNADTIAAGLSAFAPETVALQAGRIMLERLNELARERQSFAFETTLASRSFAPFLRELQTNGYTVHVAYVWLRSPDLSVDRVAGRVARGGHHVPEETVRRRYARGLTNFHRLYRPLADSWLLCDNSSKVLKHVAAGTRGQPVWLFDRVTYEEFERTTHAPDERGDAGDP